MDFAIIIYFIISSLNHYFLTNIKIHILMYVYYFFNPLNVLIYYLVFYRKTSIILFIIILFISINSNFYFHLF